MAKLPDVWGDKQPAPSPWTHALVLPSSAQHGAITCLVIPLAVLPSYPAWPKCHVVPAGMRTA